MKHRTERPPQLPRLTAAQLRQQLAAEEAGAKPDCFLCGQPVLDQTFKPSYAAGADADDRTLINSPCGHAMTYGVGLAEQVKGQMRLEAVAQATGSDSCRSVQVDGETVRVHGAGELSPQGMDALAALVRVAKRGLEDEVAGEAWEDLRSVAFDAVAGALEERDHWLPDPVRRHVADAVLDAVAARAKAVSCG
ncbi:hypothetical protein [Streptomyces griseorubiginosus]|uniref:hypothetical protein n=1 Tax=Streptomyces griseorubiginosus TaxID=67304 RepID=UPI003331F20A